MNETMHQIARIIGLDGTEGGLLPFWAAAAALIAGVMAAMLFVHALLYRILSAAVRRTPPGFDNALVSHSRKSTRLMALLLGASILLPLLGLNEGIKATADHTLSLIWIWAFAWLAVSMTMAAEEAVRKRYDLTAADNLMARKVMTQFKVFQRIAWFLIGLVALAAMLLSFKGARELGLSLLASAGVAGIVIGFSAQQTLSTLLAGIQIAVTQPIRIDDVVIVEGEWGRIEEITLTYVVVRIWDLRRLIVPVKHFIDRPFQNWTRTSADVLGTVFLHTDYTVDPEAVRHEVKRICEQEGGDDWNGQVAGLQVTDATPETVTLRALVSANDASRCWNLRCLVRERLIEFLQKTQPHALPRTRVEMEGDPFAQGEKPQGAQQEDEAGEDLGETGPGGIGQSGEGGREG